MRYKFKHSLIGLGLFLYILWSIFPMIKDSFLYLILFCILAIFLLTNFSKLRINIKKFIDSDRIQKNIKIIQLIDHKLFEFESKIINLIIVTFNKFLRTKVGKFNKIKVLSNSNTLNSIRKGYKKNPSLHIFGLIIILLIIGINFSNQMQYDRRTDELTKECDCGWSNSGYLGVSKYCC